MVADGSDGLPLMSSGARVNHGPCNAGELRMVRPIHCAARKSWPSSGQLSAVVKELARDMSQSHLNCCEPCALSGFRFNDWAVSIRLRSKIRLEHMDRSTKWAGLLFQFVASHAEAPAGNGGSQAGTLRMEFLAGREARPPATVPAETSPHQRTA